MSDLKGSLMIISNGDVLSYLAKGLMYTVLISLVAILLSLVFGAILALARNYCNRGPKRILGVLSAVYIEVFRNTPLMLWMFICFLFCPAPVFSKKLAVAIGLTSTVDVKMLFKAMVALTLFTSSVMAEIIRGGLNSVAHGQFEASQSQGFSAFFMMRKMILPQAFHNIVPTLLSQMITTIKDSSYMASLATIELMARVKLIISKANKYNGTWLGPMNRGTIHVSDVFVLFGLAFLTYFIINFSLSLVVRRLKKEAEARVMDAAASSPAFPSGEGGRAMRGRMRSSPILPTHKKSRTGEIPLTVRDFSFKNRRPAVPMPSPLGKVAEQREVG